MNIALILADGKSTRFKSDTPKSLHEINGEGILAKIVTCLELTDISQIYIVVSRENISYFKDKFGDKFKYLIQKEPNGTGGALLTIREELETMEGNLMVINADTYITNKNIFKDFLDDFENSNVEASLLTAIKKDPFSYGRVIKQSGLLKRIVEENDASSEEKIIKEVNLGVYLFKINKLRKVMRFVSSKGNLNLYITEFLNYLQTKTYTTGERDLIGINTKEDWYKASKLNQRRINLFFLSNGVKIFDLDSVFIEEGVIIEEDVSIYPGNVITGNTVIKKGTTLLPNNQIIDSKIGNNSLINNSIIISSEISKDTKVGPYSYIRDKSIIGEGAIVGCFVEVKNTVLEKNSKVKHLTYLGDSKIGKNTNIGCGVISANFDGVKKSQTIIGDDCMVGANVTLIAPLKVGDNSVLAAGSTIDQDVNPYSLAIARSRQINKDGHYKKSL